MTSFIRGRMSLYINYKGIYEKCGKNCHIHPLKAFETECNKKFVKSYVFKL